MKQVNKKVKENKVYHISHGTVGGTVLTMGEGDTGQLGLGPDIMERMKPALVSIDDPVIQVCAGGMHTTCLTEKGEVYTFGCDDEGALGRSTSDEDEMFEPGPVELDGVAVMVSAGDSHTAALMEDGKVYYWGTFRDANGSIGLLPDGSKSSLPKRFPLEQPVMKIVSGTDHLVCLTEDGEIYTAGCAEQGQLGRVAECFSQRGGRKGLGLLLTPAPVHCRQRRLRFTDVWTGQYHTFAKGSTGDVYAWGLDNYFQLGFDDMVNRFVPDKVKSFAKDKDWKQIAGGQHHTIALDKNGVVYSLGRKEYGRLGLGENNLEEKSEPTVIPELRGVKCVGVACGTAVSFAVAEDGTLYAFGMGSSKQLGQKEEDDLFVPTVITGKQLETKRGIAVSSGGQHTVLLAKNKS